MILEFCHSLCPSATSAAEEIFSRFHSMSNDLRATALTNGSEHGDSTLKAIKRVGLLIHNDFESSLVSISALVTSFHKTLLEHELGCMHRDKNESSRVSILIR